MEQTELHEKFTVGKSTLKVFKLDAQRATCRNTPATFCALDYTWAYTLLPIALLTDTFLYFPIIQIPSPLLMKN